MDIAHQLAQLMPKRLATLLRPAWHRLGLYKRYLQDGGRVGFNSELLTVEVSKPLAGLPRLSVAVRSPREFRRWANFGTDENDKLFRWLVNLGQDAILWDIGSANGLEGYAALHANKCKVVFVEPFTPSIESILKSVAIMERKSGVKPRIEIVQAACSDNPGYGRLVTHTRPVAGETFNSIGDALQTYCQGGRGTMPMSSVQWVKYITLDEMHFDCGIELPTHLKVDVDGFECKVLTGAERVFASRSIQSCVIEVNDDNGPFVSSFMERHGYLKVDELIHHQPPAPYTADFFFVRDSR